MKVLEDISVENIIAARMARFKALWASHDPPSAAQYDVGELEFDPVVIIQECSANFELMVRDRLNQDARAVMLAFGVDTDLDAIASRYPGGMPRIDGEDYTEQGDVHYRRRIQLAFNATSHHGAAGAYEFWALTADGGLKDASEIGREGTGEVIVTALDDNIVVQRANDPLIPMFRRTLYGGEPRPTLDRIINIRLFIFDAKRKAATDILTVQPARVIDIKYTIRVWFFKGPDPGTLLDTLQDELEKLIESLRWLGANHMRMDIFAALKQPGVWKAEIVSPAEDVLAGPEWFVRVSEIEIKYEGRGE